MDDVQEHRDPRDETRIEVTADVSRLIARSLNVTNIEKGMLGTESGAMVIDEYTDLRQRLIDDATDGRESRARIEHLEYLLGHYDSAIRQIAGPKARSMHDVMCVLETGEGERLALTQRLQEMSAHAITLYNHLRDFPSSEMNSGLEAQHHAVLASPRSRDSEAAAQAVIDELVQDQMRDERSNNDAMWQSTSDRHRHQVKSLEVLLKDKDEALANAEDAYQDLSDAVTMYKGEADSWHRSAWIAVGLAVVGWLVVVLQHFLT